MVTWNSTYVDNINFNELLWNYEFIYSVLQKFISLKIRPFMKILSYKNLEPYGTILSYSLGVALIQNAAQVIKLEPCLVYV